MRLRELRGPLLFTLVLFLLFEGVARVLAGLGEWAEAPQVRVIWPSGRVEVWTDVAVDRYTTLTKGQGTVVP